MIEFQHPPKIWKRYAGDVSIVINRKYSIYCNFLTQLNLLFNSVKKYNRRPWSSGCRGWNCEKGSPK